MFGVRGSEINENPENKIENNNYHDIKPESNISTQECKSFWDNLFNGKINDTYTNGKLESESREINYYSTYDERLKYVPKDNSERGAFDGEIGESKFIPIDKEIKGILDKYNLDGIKYENAIPDFSECSESTVKIDDMTENRAKNFRQCDENCAKEWNDEFKNGKSDWTPRDVAKWREENTYSWHERNDMKTCDLVPTKINAYFGHLGGVSECKKRDVSDNGGGFDE